ncbi:hypothetical protein [Klebsiella variicola]|uniref:Uncharacterized protein n=1 Tax=Klebsiella variicola TaxID=244366 RepID=A0A7H4MP97_KLEVA|nr:hypothetical protein [Klebsiella variicola]STS92147.1 Uncharacterised protein [Klebsiella variicola]
MTRYDELRSAVLRKRQKEDLYWSGLYKVYNKFNKDFSEFLGVDKEIIKDSTNERIPVLTTGVYNEEKQCVDDAFDNQLPKDNEFLCFCCCLRVGGLSAYNGTSNILFDISVYRDGDEYNFVSNILLNTIKCYEVDGNVDLTRFFEAIYNKIITDLNAQ